jgi:plasmid stabilization system protein ParE
VNYYFHPAAEAEHLETVAYYELKTPGLGATYLANFEVVMKIICAAPHKYPIAQRPDVQRKRMDKFPFTILFRVVHNSVQILAVAHHRRRPTYWLGRL